jgi:hypothetical protein
MVFERKVRTKFMWDGWGMGSRVNLGGKKNHCQSFSGAEIDANEVLFT